MVRFFKRSHCSTLRRSASLAKLTTHFGKAFQAFSALIAFAACNPMTKTEIGLEFHPNVDVSATKSLLTVSNTQVTSGSSITVTLELHDLNDQFYISKLPVVTFSNTGGTSTGTFSAVTNLGNSRYTATFTGVNAGTATTINARVVTEKSDQTISGTLPTVTVISGSLVDSLEFTTSPSLTGNTDTALSTQPVVSLKDISGNVLTSDTSSITLTAYSDTTCSTVVAGGLTATSNPVAAVSGVATFSGVKILKTSVRSIRASDGTKSVCQSTFTISAGAAAAIAVSSGNSQSAVAGAALSSSLVAIVRDANSNVVNNVTINWAVTAGGGTLGSATSLSNASGLASNTLTTGTTAGTNTVTATINGTSTSVSFTATGTAGTPTSLVVSSGNTQTGTAGSPLAASIQVLVSDTNANPVPSVSVTWTVLTGGGSVTATSTTNSSGIAAATWTLGTTAGANTAKAELTSNAALNTNFSATGTAGTPTQISITGGNSQSASLGAALGSALSVNVKDANNNNVSGATINWVASSGTLGSGASTTTNSSGDTSNTLTIGTGATAAGAKTVTATINGTSTLVTFNVTATVATPTGLAGTNGAGGTNLSWTATTGATSYKIYRSTTSGSGYTLVNTSLTNSYSDSGLTNGTTYYYVVSALNNSIESSQSAQAAVTPVVAPGAPTALSGTLASTQTVLTWTAPATGTGPFTYKVYRSTTSGSGYTNIATTGSGVVTYTNTGLTNGTTYYYVVTAVNGSVSGESAYSSEIAITPDYLPTLAYDFTNASSFQPHNLLTYSQDFSNSSWFKGNCSVQANASVAPDGTFAASKLIDNSTSAEHMISKIRTTTNETGVFSVFIKSAEYTRAQIQTSNMVNNAISFRVNLSSCTSIFISNPGVDYTNIQSSIWSVGSGWCKVVLKTTKGSFNTMHGVTIAPVDSSGNSNFAGTGSSGIYIWGAQYELNPGVSRYVATTNAAGHSFSSPLSPTYGSTSLTFSRSGTVAAATVYGSDGKLRRAPHNLLLNSEQITSSWFCGVTCTADQTIAPDGTMSADLVSGFASSSGDGFGQVLASVTTAGKPFTGSLWIRAPTADIGKQINLEIKRHSGTYVGTQKTLTLTSSWQRYDVTFTGLSDSAGLRLVFNKNSLANPADSFFVWGGQVEENLSPSAYIPTTSTARFDSPRFDYDPVTLKPNGLVVEGAATNGLTYAEEFDNAAWTKSLMSYTANVATAPDGTTTADKFVEDTSTGIHRSTNPSFSATAGTTYTGSIFLKAAERSLVSLQLTSGVAWPGGSNPVMGVDLATCTISSTTNILNSKAQNVGNGWCRFSLTQTISSSSSTGINIILRSSTGATNYTGDGTSGVFVWGAQFEAGTSATSYIPTSSAAVTRAAESATFANVAWFAGATGSFEAEALTNRYLTDNSFANQYGAVFGLRDAGTTEAIRFSFYGFSSGLPRPWFSIISSSATQFNLYATPPASGVFSKFGVAFASGDYFLNVNNGTPSTTSSGSTVGTVTSGQIGNDASNTNYPLNGSIKSFNYFNTRLPDADLNRRSQ